MKICFQKDFIYIVSGFTATLILRNCDQKCAFCPAANLAVFQNYGLLHSLFDFSCKELIIKGNIKSSYIESFLQKLKKLNPNVVIKAETCDCDLTQFIDLEYNRIIYPNLTEYLKILPNSFILPAIGDPLTLRSFAQKYRDRYPNIPLNLKILDSSNPNAEFWTINKITEFQKQIENETFQNLT